MKKIGVEFKEKGKEYYFYDNDIFLEISDYVIVETERGMQFAKVVSIADKLDNDKEHSLILKKADNKDIKQNLNNEKDAKKALNDAVTIADRLNLNMKFIDASFTFDRKQLVFQFLADNRIDFRELARELASIYKTRIELRQVGVRDKAREISGIGPCGRKLCCSIFKDELDSVSISQVKNQNLSLNPSKINGVCGRLLCCLRYEDDLYTEYRKGLPEVGDVVKYNDKDVTVISIDIPRRKYIAIDENNSKVEVVVKNEKK